MSMGSAMSARWVNSGKIEVWGPGVSGFPGPLARLHFTGNEDQSYPQDLNLTGLGAQSVEHGSVTIREIVEAARELLATVASPGAIQVREARWGWSVDGRWCPTRKIRDREIAQVRKRTGKTHVRTPG